MEEKQEDLKGGQEHMTVHAEQGLTNEWVTGKQINILVDCKETGSAGLKAGLCCVGAKGF